MIHRSISTCIISVTYPCTQVYKVKCRKPSRIRYSHNRIAKRWLKRIHHAQLGALTPPHIAPPTMSTLHETTSGTTPPRSVYYPRRHMAWVRICIPNPNVPTIFRVSFHIHTFKYKILILIITLGTMTPPKWEIGSHRYRHIDIGMPSGYMHLMWVKNNSQWTPYYVCLVSTSLVHFNTSM